MTNDFRDAKLVYKILTASEWFEFEKTGSFAGSPIDFEDGFIHLSAQGQVAETVRNHFATENVIYLVEFSVEPWGDQLKWEVSRGGEYFPHLYSKLERKTVTQHWCVEKSSSDEHVLPSGF